MLAPRSTRCAGCLSGRDGHEGSRGGTGHDHAHPSRRHGARAGAGPGRRRRAARPGQRDRPAWPAALDRDCGWGNGSRALGHRASWRCEPGRRGTAHSRLRDPSRLATARRTRRRLAVAAPAGPGRPGRPDRHLARSWPASPCPRLPGHGSSSPGLPAQLRPTWSRSHVSPASHAKHNDHAPQPDWAALAALTASSGSDLPCRRRCCSRASQAGSGQTPVAVVTGVRLPRIYHTISGISVTDSVHRECGAWLPRSGAA